LIEIIKHALESASGIEVWKGDDISVFTANLDPKNEIRIETAPGSLLFCFHLEGRSELRIGKKAGFPISSYQYFSHKDQGDILFLAAKEQSRLVLLTLSHWSFQKMLGSDAQVVRFSEDPGSMNVPMNSSLQDIMNCSWPDRSKRIFIKAKFLELIARISFSESTQKRKYIRNDYDMERILFARDYLLQRIAMPPSIPELARISGINEFKLKMGFRELFNNSVYGYLSDTRLEMAKKEMQGTKTLTEIAFELGYSSNQHFSIAFKKKFGVAPNKLRT
jgi:AraC-like DNA-binding protein